VTRQLEASATFDGDALIRALDAQRAGRELMWSALADELWRQSEDLNKRLGGDAICSGALVRTARRGTMSCQYALILLRWLGRAPEEFLAGPAVDVGNVRLPEAGPDRRLRWSLGELYIALDERRRERRLTWVTLGEALGCTPNRLTNLKTARLADMGLVMQVTQWLARPAADFIHPAEW
jgi:hypothetical protein